MACVTTDCDGRHSFCRQCIGVWLGESIYVCPHVCVNAPFLKGLEFRVELLCECVFPQGMLTPATNHFTLQF